MRLLFMTQIALDIEKSSRIHMIEFSENFKKIGNEVLMIGPTYQRNRKNKYNFNLRQLYLIRQNLISDMVYALISPFLLVYYKLTFKADIIYCRGVSRTAIIPICKLLNFKVVIEINGIIEDELKERNYNKYIISLVKSINKMNCRLADRIIVVTGGLKKRLIADFNINKNKIFVVNNGANINMFQPLDKNYCRKMLNLTNDFYVGFVGSFQPWHGIDKLIFAASFLKQSGYKRIKFLLVGNGNLTDKQRLIHLIKKMAVEEFFIFAGEIEYSKVPIYINSFDICVAPFTSVRNNSIGLSPLKVFEYLSCGKPVIISKINEISEIIQKNNCGYIFNPDDTNDLVNRIIYAYNEKEKLNRFGRNGRALVVNQYSWNENAGKIQTILNSL